MAGVFVGAQSYGYSSRNELVTAPGVGYLYDARGVRAITTMQGTGVSVTSVVLTPPVVSGGDTATGTVTLSAAAPAGGATVALTSDDQQLITVPGSVFVPAGASSATFTATTFPISVVSMTTSVRAFHQGSTATANVTVQRLVHLSSFSVSPASVVGGNQSTGTVTIDATTATDITVILSSSNASVASVPASVTVPAGSTTASFAISTVTVGSDATVTLTASYRDTRTAPLTVTVPSVTLSGVTAQPANLVGGVMNATATVTLSAPANAGGAIVTLSSSNTSAASVPATVTVPAGGTAATFTVTTMTVGSATPVAITAIYGTTQTASITVASCSTWAADAAALGSEVVWYDDATPAGAVLTGTWIWDTNQKASGTKSITSNVSTVNQEWYFTGATATMTTGSSSDLLTTWVLLDPCSPPREIMVQWNDGSWTHRAYWGANLINCGGESAACHNMGALPPVGQWARLDVSAGAVSIGNRTINGMAFDVYGGRAWFDRPGKVACNVPAGTPPASFPPTDVVWFDDATPPGAVLTGTWIWDSVQAASGTKSITSNVSTANQEWYFTGATSSLVAATAGDLLTTWVLLDPCNLPREIMLQWNDGGWGHRAYWGENLIGCGADSPSCHSMGPLPASAQWVRLDVPAGSVSLGGRTITGMAFDVYGGKAWFDRPGKTACNVAVAAPPASFPSTDVVWFDDAVPAGATPTGTWNWDTTQKASGAQSHTEPVTTGSHQHQFTGATQGLAVATGEKLVAYVLINPCDPPNEIMLQWNAASSWEHRAYWGANALGFGTDGTNSRRRIGDLPATGQWVRLEVPASQVGLEGLTVTGMAFTLNNGQVWWDRIGKAPAGSGAMKPPGPMIASMTPQSRWRTFLNRLRRGEDTLGFSVTTKLTTATGPTRSYSFYSPELQLLSETALTDTATPPFAYDYVWFGGEPLAQINTITGDIAYDLNDHLGAPLLQTSTTGSIVWRADREPYGNRYLVRASGDRYQPLGLPGQEYSENAPELQYNIFRWYRAGWGRYTQADPLATDAFTSTGERGRAVRSPYSYVEDNPLTRIDPLGLASCEGSCGEDCPGGKWAYIDANAGFAVLFGKSTGAVTYVCLSAKKVCTFAYKCTTVGLQAYAGGSVTWGAVSGCKCGSDLANVGTLNLSLIPGQFGPVINNGCVGGGIQASKNLGYQTVVGSLCSITKKLVCQ
ncbi:MAG TPA: RHS repeat-associated core domain-containing protein [Thermoanaerobaculia bacterium]|nr:RHS repeat-associated core domain-containing protein [Thermoanaerobaculia bacterium]